MYNNKKFSFIVGGFITLWIILYLDLIFYLVIHKHDTSTFYLGLMLTLFFGSQMKSICNLIFNIYFNFKEDVPKKFKESRKSIYFGVDIISIALTILILLNYNFSKLILFAIISLFVTIVVLGCIANTQHKKLIKYKTESKARYRNKNRLYARTININRIKHRRSHM